MAAEGKSSNRHAAEKLFNLQYEASVVGVDLHFCVFWDSLRVFATTAREIQKTNPAEYARLQNLFTTVQWLESPDAVADVIAGKMQVSNEVPAKLLKSIQNNNTDEKVRKDFAYYLAYKASCLED